jgi:hypothetical protein
VGPRASLDRCGKSRPTGIRSPDRPALSQSLYRLRYPAHCRSVGGSVFVIESESCSCLLSVIYYDMPCINVSSHY